MAGVAVPNHNCKLFGTPPTERVGSVSPPFGSGRAWDGFDLWSMADMRPHDFWGWVIEGYRFPACFLEHSLPESLSVTKESSHPEASMLWGSPSYVERPCGLSRKSSSWAKPSRPSSSGARHVSEENLAPAIWAAPRHSCSHLKPQSQSRARPPWAY